ncbi:hypothetical protein ACOSQ2_027562 [Xanthoceras sorbifolium]
MGRRFLFEESWADNDDCRQIVEDCRATFLVPSWKVEDLSACIALCASCLGCWNKEQLGKLKTEINKKKRALILLTEEYDLNGLEQFRFP